MQTTTELKYINWMLHLLNKDLELRELVLPGTHDSGAYALSYSYPRGSNVFKKILFFLIKLPLISKLIKINTLTQKHNIRLQLNKGVRQFDFRLAMGRDSNCYLAHTFLCNQLKTELEIINKFLVEHPGEIIIIHMKYDWPHRNNFYNTDAAMIVKLIKDTFADKLCFAAENDTLSSIEKMQKSNKRLVVCSNEQQLNMADQRLFYQNHEIWPNQKNITKVIPEIASQLAKQTRLNQNNTNFLYISLNTTPNVFSVIKDALLGISLLNLGEMMQYLYLKSCFKLIEDYKHSRLGNKVSSIMFDNITDKTIAEIIEENNREKDLSRKNNFFSFFSHCPHRGERNSLNFRSVNWNPNSHF